MTPVANREYIESQIGSCLADNATVDHVIDPAALDLLAPRPRTPLQIEDHLTLALETGYQASEKPVSEGIIESALSKQIEIWSRPWRGTATPQILAELLGAKQAEIKAMFRQTLEPDRSRELKEQMLAAGLPV